MVFGPKINLLQRLGNQEIDKLIGQSLKQESDYCTNITKNEITHVHVTKKNARQ